MRVIHGQHRIYITSDSFHSLPIQVDPSKGGKSVNGLDLVMLQVSLMYHSTGAHQSTVKPSSSVNPGGQWIWLKGWRKVWAHLKTRSAALLSTKTARASSCFLSFYASKVGSQSEILRPWREIVNTSHKSIHRRYLRLKPYESETERERRRDN